MTGENKNPNKYTLSTFALQLRDGLLDNNPTLVQLLGTCPTLATTTSVENAIGMGLAATVVLIFSNLFISLLRKLIPQQVRIAAYIVIISGFVSAVELLIRAYLPALDASLGVFIPLIVVNCIILARAEAFASKNKALPSMADGLAMGLGFTLALTVLGAVREVLGAGTLFGHALFGGALPPILMFIKPPGAFITLGIIIAVVHKLLFSAERRREKRAAVGSDAPVAPSDAPVALASAGSPPESDLEFVQDSAGDNPDNDAAGGEESAK